MAHLLLEIAPFVRDRIKQPLLRLIHSLRGQFLIGVAVIASLLLLIPAFGAGWLNQLHHMLDQVAERTAPASSQAAQTAHTAAQLIAEIHNLTTANDQYTRQNAHFGITQRATLLLQHIRELENATGRTETTAEVIDAANRLLDIVNGLNASIAHYIALTRRSESAVPPDEAALTGRLFDEITTLRETINADGRKLTQLSRLLSIHANRIMRDSEFQLTASVDASQRLLTEMRLYLTLLIAMVIGLIFVVGYFFVARHVVGEIVHLAGIVQDIRSPTLPAKLGRNRTTEFARLEDAIHQLHDALARLDEREEQFRSLERNVPGVIFQWLEEPGEDRGFTYVSPRIFDLYGVAPETCLADPRALPVHPDDAPGLRASLREAARVMADWSFEGRFVPPGGQPRWWRGLARPVSTGAGRVVFNGVIIDIDEQKRREAEMTRVLTRIEEQSLALQALAAEREQARQEAVTQSLTDALTRLSNRRHLFQVWEELDQRGFGSHDPVAILMIDLDHFKYINDNHGHAAGDAVLIEVANRLRQNLPEDTLIARLGGEEFAILLTNDAARAAARVAERLRQTIGDSPCRFPDGIAHVTASLGVATTTYKPDALDRLLSQADTALYQAKSAGRNRVVGGPSVTMQLVPETAASARRAPRQNPLQLP